jgi:hypothetical protein
MTAVITTVMTAARTVVTNVVDGITLETLGIDELSYCTYNDNYSIISS